MNTSLTCLLIFIGAGLGANARYWLTAWIAHRYGVLFPWGTLTVNVIGSFLIGVLAGVMLGSDTVGHHWRLLLVVGLLGGFTTFSTFSLETLQLVRQQAWGPTIAYVGGSVIVGLATCAMGLFTVRALMNTGSSS